MKLNIVRPRTGLRWVRLGVRTFARQPLALVGLFFMFMAAMSVASLVPVIGSALALAILPAATLGLMAAAQQADSGKFPMPSVLLTGLRAGRQRLRAMVTLGAMHSAAVMLVMGLSALVDGGHFAKVYLGGGNLTPEVVQSSEFQQAMWLALALYTPVSLLFWHAPALVHWGGVSPAKSLFFSFVACMRNFGAYTVFGLCWALMILGGGIGITAVALALGSPDLINAAMMPLVIVMAAMFITSIYFTFRDSFVAVDELLNSPTEQDMP